MLLYCLSLLFCLVCRLVLAHTELTSAVLLVVEAILAQQLVAPVAESSLAPVLGPEHRAGHGLLGRQTGSGDLLDALPSRRGQRGGEILQPQLARLLGGSCETQGEAAQTAAAALRLILQTADATAPRRMVIVAVNPRQAEALGMALALLLADVVFLAGEDVGIVVKDGGTHAILQHPFHDGAAARGTTGMEQHFAASILRQLYGGFLHTF